MALMNTYYLHKMLLSLIRETRRHLWRHSKNNSGSTAGATCQGSVKKHNTKNL